MQAKHSYTFNKNNSRKGCLEGRFTSYSFSKITVVCPFLGPVPFTAIDPWPCSQYIVWVLPCGTGLKPNQKVVGYPIAFTLLSHQWTPVARLVVIVAHRVHIWLLFNSIDFFSHRPFICSLYILVFWPNCVLQIGLLCFLFRILTINLAKDSQL